MQPSESKPIRGIEVPDNKQPDAELLNQKDAAKFLGVAPNWLEKRRGLRGIPGGPPFVRLGGFVRYKVSDLREYVDSLEVVDTTDANAGEG